MATEPMSDARLVEIRAEHEKTRGSSFSPSLTLTIAKDWINDLHQWRGELLREVDRLRPEGRRVDPLPPAAYDPLLTLKAELAHAQNRLAMQALRLADAHANTSDLAREAYEDRRTWRKERAAFMALLEAVEDLRSWSPLDPIYIAAQRCREVI